ncbi:MAG TPA: serine protease, partial [Pilimelia sp.]|nr:serine protease [Pilimelia sp.]
RASVVPAASPVGAAHRLPPAAAAGPPGGAPAADLTGAAHLGGCSAAVVRVPGARPRQPALLLTNGHCLPDGMPGPGVVRVDEPAAVPVTVRGPGDRSAEVRADRLLYATMTGTDVALYRLSDSYATLRARAGVTPFTLAARGPRPGAAVRVPSAYWGRVYHCTVEALVPRLREHHWTWRAAIRYAPDCQPVGGTSGAPLVAAGTRTVVGVNNTGNEQGGRCTLMNPCEVDGRGRVTVRPHRGYGQQTAGLRGCLRGGVRLDLSLPGCRLPRGAPAAGPPSPPAR